MTPAQWKFDSEPIEEMDNQQESRWPDIELTPLRIIGSLAAVSFVAQWWTWAIFGLSENIGQAWAATTALLVAITVGLFMKETL